MRHGARREVRFHIIKYVYLNGPVFYFDEIDKNWD